MNKGSHFLSLLHKPMTRKDFLRTGAIGIISIFGATGVITELLSHAASPYESREAEAGTASGNTTLLTDSTASGSKALQFGTTTVKTGVGPSGIPMPVGNLSGWTQVFADDFSSNFTEGTIPTASGTSWPAPYTGHWDCYTNFHSTDGVGFYDAGILSVVNSTLKMHLYVDSSGVPHCAAPLPILDGHTSAYSGQTYGRWDFCMKSDGGLSDFLVAYLLWPDSDVWAQGEIDFPNSYLVGYVSGYVHEVGSNPGNSVNYVDDKSVYYTSWHVYSIQWTSAGVSFWIDGTQVMYSPASQGGTPSVPHHFVMQTETDGPGAGGGTGHPASNINGYTYCDWVVIYSQA
jgi:hypothetical protein